MNSEYIRRRIRKEISWQCYGWRFLRGPAAILDGLIETVSLGFINSEFQLFIGRKHAEAYRDARIKRAKKGINDAPKRTDRS